MAHKCKNCGEVFGVLDSLDIPKMNEQKDKHELSHGKDFKGWGYFFYYV